MRCICCNKLVKPYTPANPLSHEDSVFKIEERRYKLEGQHITETIKAENRMWLHGAVANVSTGYGSSLDGDQFVIAVCDNCLLDKVEDGTIAYTGNCLGGDHINKLEKYKKIWRRYNNLDDLLD